MGARKGFVKIIGLVVIVVILIAAASLIIKQNDTIDLTDQTQLKRFASEKELDDFLNNSAATNIATADAALGGKTTGTTAESAQPAAMQGNAVRQASADDYSQTNIQVQGVDEADYVKNDGKYIYTISGSSVVIIDAYPAENAKIVSEINLSTVPQQIYINDDKLVVFGNGYNYDNDPGTLTTKESGVAAEIMMPRYYGGYSFTRVDIYDITQRESPVLESEFEINGTYYDSRMIGDYVYAILNTPTYGYGRYPIFSPYQSGFPDIYYFDVPDYSYQYTNIMSINVKNPSDIKNKVFLMSYSTNMFVSENNIYMVYQKRIKQSYVLDRIVDEVILPEAPADIAKQIKDIRDSDRLEYEKTQKIQETLNDWIESIGPEKAAEMQKKLTERYQEISIDIQKETDKSVIHKISIDNGNIEYKTKGEVPGSPLNQFSMDENNGYFRIATTTSNFGGFVSTGIGVQRAGTGAEPAVQTTGTSSGIKKSESPQTKQEPADDAVNVELTDIVSENTNIVKEEIQSPPTSLNHMYVLDENMNMVGKIEDLAPNERIYSARFIGDRAYMVTFVRIDPLFVIDLSDPRDPKVLGELKIPGVSDYLHPYDDTHLIGVGKSTDEQNDQWARFKGVKLSLFDVSDVENPKELAKYEIGERGTDSEALRDHKAFLFSKSKNLLVIPIMLVENATTQWGVPTWQGAYVFEVTPENGFVLKGRVTHIDTDEKLKENSFVQFDLSSIPEGADVRNARLILYRTSYGWNSIKVDVYKVTGEWNENSITYSDEPSYDTTVLDSQNIQYRYDIPMKIMPGGYQAYTTHYWDVTSAVVSWVNGENNHGLKLSSETPVDIYDYTARFYSSDYGNDDISPKLEITYLENGNEKNITIASSKDAYTSSFKPDNNYGDATELRTKTGIMEYVYYGPYSIKRSLYIGDNLYTLSDSMVKANKLSDLEEAAKIKLPYTENYYGPYLAI